MWAILLFTSFLANAQFTLNTVPPLAGGNGSGGTTFQVTANNSIFIDGFSAALQNGNQTVEIWYSATDLTGAPNIASPDWTKLGEAIVFGQSSGLFPVLQSLPIPVSLAMSAGTTYRFYIGCATCNVVYSDYTTNSGNPYSDANISINTGPNVGYGGSLPNPTFATRQFNGGVSYTVLANVDASITEVVAPIQPVVGNNNLTVRVTNFGQTTITQADLSYRFNNGATVSVNDAVFPFPIPIGGIYDYQFATPFVVPALGSYSIQAYVSDVNGAGPDIEQNNDTLSTNLCTPLSGNYTINSGTATGGVNFASFAEAINVLQSCGVSGPVVFDVANGVYLEQLVINEIAGTSSANTITFKGNPSLVSTTILRHNVSSSFSNYVLSLEGADYLSFENLAFESLNSSLSRVIQITSAAEYNTIIECRLIAPVNYSSSSLNNALVYSSNSQDNYNTFLNNVLIGGSHGFYLNGEIAGSLPEVGNRIEGNELINQSVYGIRSSITEGLKVINNEMRTNSTNTSATYGFQFSRTNGAFEIVNNRIKSTGDVPVTGLSIGISNGTSTNRGLIANNALKLGSPNSNVAHRGLELVSCTFLNVLHNSIALEEMATTGRAFSLVSCSSLNIYNNIFANLGFGYGLYGVGSSAFGNMDHTVTFSSGAEPAYFNNGLGAFGSWQAATGQDANGFETFPDFADVTNGDLHTCKPQLNNAGKNLNGLLNIDFDGQARNQAAPDIGADEFDPAASFSFPQPTVAICSGQSVILYGDLNGATNVWSTGVTADSIVVSTAGTWTVTSTNACGTSQDVVTTTLGGPTISLSTTPEVNFGSNGSVTSTVSNGATPYTYSWSNGSTSANLSGLAAGVYTVTVTDASGCTKVAQATVASNNTGGPAIVTSFCGATLNALSDYIFYASVSGATNYRYQIISGSFNVVHVRGFAAPSFQMTSVPGIQYNTTYSVQVAALVNGNWTTYGPVCSIATPPAAPTTTLGTSSCGITLNSLGEWLYINSVPGAANYRYRVTAGGFSQVYTRGYQWTNFKLSFIPGISYNTTYNVEVAAFIDGSWGPYGSACQVTTPSNVPLTQMVSSQCNITLSSWNQYLFYQGVPGADNYRVEITNTGSGFNTVYVRGYQWTTRRFDWASNNYLPNTTYNVRVAASVNGTWGSYGPVCTITTPATPQPRLAVAFESNESNKEKATQELTLFPNPAHDQVWLQGGWETNESVTLQVFDLTGKRILIQNLEVEAAGNPIHLSVDGFSPGLYLVQVQREVSTQTVRLIVRQ